MVHVLQTMQNLVILLYIIFTQDSKEMYQEL